MNEHKQKKWKSYYADCLSIVDEYGLSIAEVSNSVYIPDPRANAQLIASAPELLSALEYVLENHHEGDGEFHDLVRDAIDKATE